MTSDGAAAGVKGGQAVVGEGRLGIGEDADRGPGGEKEGGRGVYGWYGDG